MTGDRNPNSSPPPLEGRPELKLCEAKELQISPSLLEGRRRGTSLRGGVNRNTLSATSVSPPRVSSLRLASRPSQREGEVKPDDLLAGVVGRGSQSKYRCEGDHA